MNTNHTPGPWSIAETIHEEPHESTYAVIGNEKALRGLTVREGTTVVEHVALVEGEANAHLIAAAPELLAALHEAREQLTYLRERLSPKAQQFTAPTTEKALATIDAAIAKAKGGAQFTAQLPKTPGTPPQSPTHGNVE